MLLPVYVRYFAESDEIMERDSGKKYYSRRIRPGSLALTDFRTLFFALYKELELKGYFQEAFGYYCVDAGEVSGTVGERVDLYILRKLRKPLLLPHENTIGSYAEDDCFDMIEFLYDHVSLPIDGLYHSYSDCGWHYDKFDQKKGQSEFRDSINEIIADLDPPQMLDTDGQIKLLGTDGLRELHKAPLPAEADYTTIQAKVDRAVAKYRDRNSSVDDRREAVRELADVLEFLRPSVKTHLLKADEQALFNIANNFGIRHHNQRQRREYSAVWLSWMFYMYLATVHLCVRLPRGNAKG